MYYTMSINKCNERFGKVYTSKFKLGGVVLIFEKTNTMRVFTLKC